MNMTRYQHDQEIMMINDDLDGKVYDVDAYVSP